MDTIIPQTGATPSPEIEAERRTRFAWEALVIARARAAAEAGCIVTSQAVDAWIESLDTDHELPPPRPGQ